MTTRLTVLGFTASDELEAARVAEARLLRPDIEATVIDGPLDEAAFLAAHASGDAPDLVYLDRELIGEFAARGLIQPLDDAFEREGIARRQFRDAALRHVTFRGATYGIPEYTDLTFLFVHLPALASVSVLPREIEFGDWIQLPQANRALTLEFPSGLGRAGVETGLPDSLPLWAKANGADLLSADGRHAQLDDPRVVEALDVAARMIDDQGGWARVQAFADSLECFGPENPFARNRVGVMAMDASYLDVLAEHSPHLELLVKPVVDRWGGAIPLVRGMAWAVPARAPHPGRSFAFAWAMARPETWVVGAQARAAAARAAGRRFEEPATANKDADLAIWQTAAEPMGHRIWDTAVQVVRTFQETGFVVPPNAAPRAVRAAWVAGVKRALSGEVAPLVAMRAANRQAQAALDAAG
jgi:multiple sugar transport system substrate-binding protein